MTKFQECVGSFFFKSSNSYDIEVCRMEDELQSTNSKACNYDIKYFKINFPSGNYQWVLVRVVIGILPLV